MYKTVKLFDCQDMPKDVRKEFFKTCGSPSFRGANDCIVAWHIGVTSDKVDAWLLKNGVTQEDEAVTIKHWW